jgi:hypothetical protein
LAKDHGDKLGHRVIRSKKNSSRVATSRSTNSSLVGGPLPVSTNAVTKERGSQDEIARIWWIEEELYWGG